MDMFLTFNWFSKGRQWGLLSFGLILAMVSAIGTAQVDELPSVSKSTDITPSSFLHNLSGLFLVDQNNQPFDPAALKGKVVVFNFIFTRCGSVCPMQTKDLASVKKQLAAHVSAQVHFISVSVDPDHDTPETLKAYAAKMHADSAQWSFLTGSQAQLQILLSRLKVVGKPDQQAEVENHKTSLWLMDKQGRMLQRYRGDPIDKNRLVRELTQVTSLGLHLSVNE